MNSLLCSWLRFSRSAGVILLAAGCAHRVPPSPVLSRVDHLVYATPDLERTVSVLEERLGIRASAGGRQEGRGTRSALMALGSHTYLEIVAPDTLQRAPAQPPWWLPALKEPRIVAWAAHAPANLDSVRAEALRRGVPLGEVLSGSRTRPDGVTLTWRLTSPRRPVAGGVVPFLINWGDSPHPARTSPQGATLEDLRAEHPDPAAVREMLRRLNIEMPVVRSATPALKATIRGPRGTVELR